MILFPQWYGNISSGLATRIAFVLVGVWWFVFAQFTFSKLKDSKGSGSSKGHYIFNGYLELKKVWKELKDSSMLLSYLISFFFFNMGVQTVMYAASLFGQVELHLDSSVLITIILIIQFVAIAGAFVFSSLSKRYGNLIALSIAIVIWIFICIGAFLCNKEYGVDEKTMFMGLAAIVGFVMGGIQSLSRSTYSKMLPDTLDHASYFSFYDVCDKIGTVIGTFAFGFINAITGSMRSSIIALAVFFIIGLILLLRVRRIQSMKTKYA
jgi:UMF1 family MFS transporter